MFPVLLTDRNEARWMGCQLNSADTEGVIPSGVATGDREKKWRMGGWTTSDMMQKTYGNLLHPFRNKPVAGRGSAKRQRRGVQLL